MTNYRVTWEVDIEAESPEDAARQAREIQLDPENTATIFAVASVHNRTDIDLLNP